MFYFLIICALFMLEHGLDLIYVVPAVGMFASLICITSKGAKGLITVFKSYRIICKLVDDYHR